MIPTIRRRGLIIPLASGLALEAGCLVLAFAGGGSDIRVFLAVAAMGFMGAAYLVLAAFLLRRGWPDGLGLGALLAAAGLFYATLLPGAPTLDNDLYRYLWDGKVSLAGIDPYAYAPVDPALKGLRDEQWGKIGYPHVKTPYPPAAQLLFAGLRYLSGGGPTAAKALLGLFFAGSVWLLTAILSLAGKDRRWVILYAWNPLVLKELADSGHLEAAAVFFLLAAVFLSLRGRDAAAGAALALGTMTKVFPVLALPFLLFRSRRPAAFAAAFAAAASLLWLPYLGAGGHALGSLPTYARWWLFNHGSYALWEWLWRALAPAAWWREGARLSFWAGAAAWSAAAGWLARARGAEGLCRSLGVYLFLVVVLSPTVMPWYLIWSLPLLAVRPSMTPAVFSVLSMSSYLYYLAHKDVPLFRWAEYGALLAWVALERRWFEAGAGPGATGEEGTGPPGQGRPGARTA